MSDLLKCEFYKLKKSMPPRILFLVMASGGIVMAVTSCFMENMMIEDGMESRLQGIGAFLGTLSDTYLVVLLSAVMSGIFIAADFENGMFETAVSLGYTRTEVLFSKTLAYFTAVLALSTPYPVIYGICMGIRYGFGAEPDVRILSKLALLFLSILFTYLAISSVCILISFLLRKSNLVTGACILTIFIGGNLISILGALFPQLENLYAYTPQALCRFVSGIDSPYANIPKVISASLIWIVLSLTASCNIFRKTELK